MLDDEHHFPQPTGGRKNGLSRGLDAGVRICDTGHGSSLTWEYSHSSLVRRHIFPRPRYFLATRCAIRGSGGKGGSLAKLTINENEDVLMLAETVIRRLEAL